MNCPYCSKEIYGLTGLQEAQAFEKHLRKCRKNPYNIANSVRKRITGEGGGRQDFRDALEIRAESGQ